MATDYRPLLTNIIHYSLFIIFIPLNSNSFGTLASPLLNSLGAEENALSKQADEALKSGKAVAWDTSDLDGAKSTKPTVKHFSLLRVLGKGSFGKVVLVRKKFGLQIGGLFAMKVLRKSHLVKRHQIERTKTERRVLAVADHPFIMKLHFAFQNGEKLYLVLDYCPGGELFFHLCRHRRFPERVARFYAAELLLAIGHLHSIGIIYRDLKPEVSSFRCQRCPPSLN